eukprot:GDKI01049841.1.p1 GENE.GDKI01049841.1~~GDKI01049841.1.p1  ORF type:complete len:432 (-),score=167.02 GDKI01049841.1:368-1663(-)
MPGSIPPGYCAGVWEWTELAGDGGDFEPLDAKHPKQLETRADGTVDECAAQTKFGAVSKVDDLRDSNNRLKAHVFEANDGKTKRTIMCIDEGGMQRRRACAMTQANKGVPVEGEIAAPRLHDAWRCGNGKGEYGVCVEMEHITAVGHDEFDEEDKAVPMGTKLISRFVDMMDRGVISNQLWRDLVALLDDQTAVQGDFAQTIMCKDTVPMFMRPLMLANAVVNAAWNYMGDQTLIQEAGKIWEQAAAGAYKSDKMPSIQKLQLSGAGPEDRISAVLQHSIRSERVDLSEDNAAFDLTNELVNMELLNAGVFVLTVDRAEVTVEMKNKDQTTAKVTNWAFTGPADRWGKNGDEMREKIRLAALEQCPPLAAFDGIESLVWIRMMMSGLVPGGNQAFKFETKEVLKEDGVIAYTFSMTKKGGNNFKATNIVVQ